MPSLIEVNNLSKRYKVNTTWWKKEWHTVLKPVSFKLEPQETLAVIGGIGSGKSVLAKLLVGAARPTTGEITLNGQHLQTGNFKQRCQHVRMIFQDAGNTLNPSLTIKQQLEEPLLLNTRMEPQERTLHIRQTLQKVGMLADHMHFYPHMFSGGQKQRISLARAIILEPQLVILDEALAALDLSLRAQMMNLLLDLQEQMGLAYLLISHDLDIVEHLSDKIIVLRDGEVVESGYTDQVLKNPRDKYTKKLILSQRKRPSMSNKPTKKRS